MSDDNRMTDRPTGTVTFLFTDIEGSTQMWENHSEAMPAALARHDALIRHAVSSSSGHVFKTIGDAVCATFRTAPEALEAALESQRALTAEDWSTFGADFGPLMVRMGLHTGAAEERDGDYFGQPLNRCARLVAAGHGGQILTSLATQQLLRDKLPAGLLLRDLGVHRLKDLTHSEHVFQVSGPGMPDIREPLVTAGRLRVGDRIVLDDAAEPRSLTETLAALRHVVVDETAAARLTPEQVRQVINHRPSDIDAYRLGRIAEWSQPRHRIDGRFVALELMLDSGEDAVTGRWEAREEKFDDLGTLLSDVSDPALVVLGPPGAGKSTLLRHFELNAAIRALTREGDNDTDRQPEPVPITFFIQLNQYKPARLGEAPPSPGSWLAERWTLRYPDLPSLGELLVSGRMVLLLDGLNEMPLQSEAQYSQALGLWKDWLHRLVGDMPGNRVVFSCRSLDYSQPLSTPVLRVPQVRVEPMSDDRVRAFLKVYCPLHWQEMWGQLEGSPQLEVLRSPYFLSLLTEQVEATGDMPEGRAGLFTGFVRQTLRREAEQENPLFSPGALMTGRDIRRLTLWRWTTAFELPERGVLLPKLCELAFGMQAACLDGEMSEVRVHYDDALELINDEHGEDIVRAGVAVSVLDEDPSTDEVMFIHQLVQEYFAGRRLALSPDPELLRAAWRTQEVSPSLLETIDGLAPSDTLPALPRTGWEETAIFAAAMSQDTAGFLRGLMQTSLPLAAACAAQSEALSSLSPDLVAELQQLLMERTDDVQADLRHRIACGYALGEFGDPRFDRRFGPHGEYVVPPLVALPGGLYPIGDDEPIEWSWTGASGKTTAHIPGHHVDIAPFQIGRFPVTNAEWACFVDAGGYEDDSWWASASGRAWRRGELGDEGAKANNRIWRARFLEKPHLLDQMVEERRFADDDAVARWREWLLLDEASFEAALDERWRPQTEFEPRFWRDRRFNHPSQPVVGVSWYEARAYCAWLSAQAGMAVRLPTEVESEAAARGTAGRRYVEGDELDTLSANTFEAHVKQTSPVGVFPNGRTPEGVDDLAGNVYEWTSSLFGSTGASDDEAEFRYPYVASDGREDADAPPNVRRVLRGGAWNNVSSNARAVSRNCDPPTNRLSHYGLRIVVGNAKLDAMSQRHL